MGNGEQAEDRRTTTRTAGHRVNTRSRLGAVPSALVPLPADISFLQDGAVAAHHLAEAAALSRKPGQGCASEILIARGHLDRDWYEARLAALLGAHHSRYGPDPQELADANACLDSAAIIAGAGKNRKLFVAPQTAGYLFVAEMVQKNPGCFANAVFCSAMALRLAIFEKRKPFFLDHAVHGLRRDKPHYSAYRRITGRQAAWASGMVAATALALFLAPSITLAFGGLLLSVFYLAIVLLRSMLVALLDRIPAGGNGNATGMHQPPPEVHPAYSIMVALHDEAGQVGDLVAALEKLDWPETRREVLLVCEENDHETISAIRQIRLPNGFHLVACPHAQPKTKPKALAFALPLCSGEYCVIYDAEDRPHPSQLREAWTKFTHSDARLACLQAPLVIHNHRHNWLTTMFAMEYQAQFLGMLPALEHLRAPIPLGGTSNHFRTGVLREVGGWDPFNVTEDADLGIRLARSGYRCGTISAPTFEEAPPVLDVWLKQRTRWLKGWLQTILVHTRNPAGARRELGLGNVAMFHLVITAIVISMLIHPGFLVLTAVQAMSLGKGGHHGIAHLWITGMTFFNLAAGYTTYAALVIAVRQRSRWQVSGLYLLTLPAYWLLISVAGWRALFQLVTNPFKWEKTAHGLSNPSRNANIGFGSLQAHQPAGSENRKSGGGHPAP